ncbi:ATP-dependent RNA helicase WM6-like [Contarinia nasturtii]|uniref:ATP-dependent RNA helicase WM6-like n=1 Tax=Contarinia nasturtii TaxID=265458 RepID=UPI0012D3B478|nr:ATP-dependent RNA helicase WM6-like [Contarinia nasturtii]
MPNQEMNEFERAKVHDFGNMKFKPEIQNFIDKSHLKKPSNADVKCIRRFVDGFNIVCGAKLNMDKSDVLVLATSQLLEPTKNIEILVICSSLDFADVIKKRYKELNVESKVYICSEKEDIIIETLKAETPHTVIGTLDCISKLIELKEIEWEHLKYLIWDEFDKISEPVGIRYALVKDILQKTPQIKRVMMFASSVFSEGERIIHKAILKNPIFVDNETKLILHGLRHYYIKTQERERVEKILELLEAMNPDKAVIFVNSHAAEYKEIFSYLPKYEQFDQRILITTHLNAHNTENIQGVKMIINYDLPNDADAYIDRVNCVAMNRSTIITFVSNEDAEMLEKIQKRFDIKMTEVSEVTAVVSWVYRFERLHCPPLSRDMVQVLYQKIKSITKK